MLGEIRPSDLERFWSKVATVVTPAGCIEWTGAMAKDYGVIRWKWDRMTQATRVAWELFYECPPDPELDLLHSCDNRVCVNILHLSEDTRARNMVEAYDRLRLPYGTNNVHSKLTSDVVSEYRRIYRNGGVSIATLANSAQVSNSTMRDCIRGITWRRLIEPPVITTTTARS